MGSKTLKQQNLRTDEVIITPVQKKGSPDGMIRAYSRMAERHGPAIGIVVGQSDGLPALLYGHTALEAYRRMGIKEVPAVVVEGSSAEQIELSLQLSQLGESRDALSEGRMIHDLLRTYRVSRKRIMELTGKSKVWLSRRETLAKSLCGEVMELVSADVLSPRTAEAIARLPADKQIPFSKTVAEQSLTQNEVEKIVSRFNQSSHEPSRDSLLEDPNLTLVRPAKSRKTQRTLSAVLKDLLHTLRELLVLLSDTDADVMGSEIELIQSLHDMMLDHVVPLLSASIRDVSIWKQVGRE
jgi:ParB-like chromosome segregation protein Spo0J